MGVLSSREGWRDVRDIRYVRDGRLTFATEEHLPEVRLRLEAATWKGKARIFKSEVIASKLIELDSSDPNHYVQT